MRSDGDFGADLQARKRIWGCRYRHADAVDVNYRGVEFERKHGSAQRSNQLATLLEANICTTVRQLGLGFHRPERLRRAVASAANQALCAAVGWPSLPAPAPVEATARRSRSGR